MDADAGKHERAPKLIVGLGASAGGIGALKQLFAHVPANTGNAYVVILHLSPDYESHLAQVLQTATHMPVTQVQGEVAMVPDHVYVIPPNANLAMTDGHLAVTRIDATEPRVAAVDFFFRRLADAYGAKAVAIVLSGTGTDGAGGIKRVKESGGLVLVQDPAQADYDDMPRNSVATGLADFVVAVEQMPGLIQSYRDRPRTDTDDEGATPSPDIATLREALTLLRVRTGHDFSNYKPATLLRRIERRVHVNGLADARQYIQVLRERPEEAGLLMNELLISVTNFFRDPAAYQVLEKQIIPKLFENKQTGDHVRVWVAGSATGEEAYSLGMLLAEHSTTSLTAPQVQLFATDLDERAIAVARDGLYTENDVADVAPERLRRFFIRERAGFRVRRELRELVLFATHNMLKDPPFSHLDLVACRNVLIYLSRPAQERLLETFHFALRAGRFLFLGQSETADVASDLFMAVDKAAHIFESRPVSTPRTAPINYDAPQLTSMRPQPASLVIGAPDRMFPGEMHLRLLESYAPPSILLTEEHHLLHVSESAARFLELNPGEPSRDIFKLIIQDLRVDLRAALHQAVQQRTMVEVPNVPLSAQRGGGSVTITVRPALREYDPALGYFLVFFQHHDASGTEPENTPVRMLNPSETPVPQLEEELSRVRMQLRATIEQYETHVEEAKAANEELQAMNEELRSAAEELETGKEELQSVNEELITVNLELKLKIDELALANNDLQNFINSTDIGTIFLDRQLRVKLFTVRTRDIFNLLPSDTGRPLSDLTSTLDDSGLHEDLKQVLEQLHTIEREVKTKDGRSFLMRILPYRTADDRADGVVLTFLELRNRKQLSGSI